MTARTLQDLSNSELQQLSNAAKTGTYTEQDTALIKTLDNSTLQKLSDYHTSIAAKPVQSVGPQSTVEDIKGKAIAGSFGLLDSSADAIEGMGTLAKNILKSGANLIYPKDTAAYVNEGLDKGAGLIDKGYNAIRDKVLPTPNDYEQQQIQQHPQAYGIGGMIGSVGTSTGIMNKALTPVVNAASSIGLQKILPQSLQSPVAKNVIGQGALATGLGAASNPDHPLEGAIAALPYGLASGLVGGMTGAKVKRAGDIVDYETKNIIDAGANPNSIEGLSRIKKTLKDNGADYSKNLVQTQISNAIKEKIETVDPLNLQTQAPTQVIAKLAQTNYAKVSEEINALKKPLVSNTTQFEMPNTGQALVQFKADVPSKLPTISETPTFDKMWEFRQKLDADINALKANKRALPSEIFPLVQIRNAVTADMEGAANKMGMGQQFTDLMTKYSQEFAPFQAFKTKSGKLVSPADVNDAMSKLNRVFMQRNVDINIVKQISKTLGPQGDELIGKAMLQNIYLKSLNDKGVVQPKTYFTMLKKYSSSGLDAEIWGPKTREAALGLKKILDGADEALRMGSPQDPMSVIKYIPNLLATNRGIDLLRMIGSSKTPQTHVRNLVQQVITGTLAISAGKTATQETK